MVQTRSKYRLLENNSATLASEKPTQPCSSSKKTVNRKRKRNNDNNDEHEQIITDSTMTIASSLTSSTVDHVVIEPMIVSSISTSPDGHLNNITDDQYNNQPAQATSSSLFNLSTVLSLEAADHVPEDDDDDDNRQLNKSYLMNNSSDFEEDNFDNNLHVHQQMLIDALNREENEQEILQSDDINSAAVVLQTSDSWPIEKSNLQWTKTRMGKDCLIIGNFSYIYMSASEKKNVQNFRCQRRDVKCGAVVHLSLDTRTFIDTNGVNHNHPPDRFGMKQKVLNQKIDDKLAVEPTSVLKVIERVYADANLTDEEQLHIRLPRTAGKY
jgi:hypothetical protein